MARPQEILRCLACHGPDCTIRGSVAIWDDLAQRLAAAGSDVVVEPYFCFGACPDGPNIVAYPQGTWYSLVQPDDAEEIAAHMLGGPRVERLMGKVDYNLQGLILELIDSGFGKFTDD